MLLTTFAGPIELSQAEQGRLLVLLIYFPLTYVVFPVLLVLWLIYLFKHFVRHQKSPRLLKVNIIATIAVIAIFMLASPIIEILFGKLEY